MDGVGAGEDQQARRVAVEPVHEAGALGIVAAGDLARERLHERARAVAARRVDDDARRLVHDEQVLVLVGDAERRGRDRRGGRRRLRRPHRDPLAAGEHVALGARRAVDGHVAAVDQPLRRGARAGVRGEEDVQPLAGRLGAGRSAHPPSGCGAAAGAAPPRRRRGPSST